MRREVPSAQMPGLGEQLAVLPPWAKLAVGPLMLAMGVVAVVLEPVSFFAWVLFSVAIFLGGPLLVKGAGELGEQRTFARECARARDEMPTLKADLAEAVQEKRGVERFLIDRGYTSAKVRRWISLECGIVPPRSSR